MALTPADGVPTGSVVNFGNPRTIARETLRRGVAILSLGRMTEAVPQTSGGHGMVTCAVGVQSK